MDINIRKFQKEDIPHKVKWINYDENNQYLHYDLPLREDKTMLWFNAIKDREDRADYTITYNGDPIGLIGLLNIDYKNRKAEYYIMLGCVEHKGKGFALAATRIMINEGFNTYNLNRIYLYTEVKNIFAQNLFEKIGFVKEGLLREDIIYNGRKVDRFIYGLLAEEYFQKRH